VIFLVDFVSAYTTHNQKLTTAYNQAGSNFQSVYIPVFND